MRLNGRAATIVGVAPSGFAFPKGAEIWQPLIAAPEVLQEGWFTLLGRLKPTVTLAQASDEASALLTELRSVAPPRSPQNARTRVVSLKDAVIGDVRPVMALFVVAAVLLFLVGSINVVILLLVRGTARAREISVCAALGATPAALIGQLVVETTLWVIVGGGLGTFAAYWLATFARRCRPGRNYAAGHHSLQRSNTHVGGWRRAALGVDRGYRAGVVDGSVRAFQPIAGHWRRWLLQPSRSGRPAGARRRTTRIRVAGDRRRRSARPHVAAVADRRSRLLAGEVERGARAARGIGV